MGVAAIEDEGGWKWKAGRFAGGYRRRGTEREVEAEEKGGIG